MGAHPNRLRGSAANGRSHHDRAGFDAGRLHLGSAEPGIDEAVEGVGTVHGRIVGAGFVFCRAAVRSTVRSSVRGADNGAVFSPAIGCGDDDAAGAVDDCRSRDGADRRLNSTRGP